MTSPAPSSSDFGANSPRHRDHSIDIEQTRAGSEHTTPTKGEANSPWTIPWSGWKQVLLRVKDEIGKDRLSMVAGGISFYGFLAMFPALAALISVWGLLADAEQVEGFIASLSGALPDAAVKLIGDAATRIASSSTKELSGGVALSILLTIWSAKKGMKGVVDGISIAYDEDPSRRGFIKDNLLTVGLTAGGTVLCIVTLGFVVAVPPIVERMWLGSLLESVLKLARWPILAAMVMLSLAVVYRVAPPRSDARWRWITPGSLLAVVLWLGASAGFSYYTQNFGSYDKTYGSLAAVAILLMWFYISAFIVLLGAELNSELEKQTARDSTTGPSEPIGSRGAVAADRAVPLEKN